MRAYVVSVNDILSNLVEIRKKADSATVIAVLKGDGYGLGLTTMAKFCRDAGIHHFAVTEAKDVRRLRLDGDEGDEILLLRPTRDPDEIRALLDEDAIFTVASQKDAVALSGVARDMGALAKVHLKIDTGMGRYGFMEEELDEILSCYAYLDCLSICGIYTHFHSAFCNKKATRLQADAFLRVVEAVRGAGYDVGMVHACNSSALFRHPDYLFDGVRVGSAILGRLNFRTNLKKVGVCQVSVDEIRWLPQGHTTGYGGAWKAKRSTRIAVLPVGWYHGYTTTYGNDVCRFRDSLRKVLSGIKDMLFPRKLYVTIRGEKCRVLGHVGMLHTVVDVTDKRVFEGDIATVEINPTRIRGMEIRFE